jgi:hypothetical protein
VCYEIAKMATEDGYIREPVGVAVLVGMSVDEGVEDGKEGWERGCHGRGGGHGGRRYGWGHELCAMMLTVTRWVSRARRVLSYANGRRRVMVDSGRWLFDRQLFGGVIR